MESKLGGAIGAGLTRCSDWPYNSPRARTEEKKKKELPLMGILADWQIQELIKIEPFADGSARPGRISFGASSYGYDVRVGRRFKIFTNALCAVVDPKNFDPTSFVDIEGDSCLIPPNSFALAETVEYLEIPRDILAICVGKSTYARCGIIVNVTPLEPEWRGKITIEISNTTPLPAKVYAGEGIAQILFLRADAVCKISYGDKKGKYQDQSGLTLPFVTGGKQP
jgi:dCTP deaminase